MQVHLYYFVYLGIHFVTLKKNLLNFWYVRRFCRCLNWRSQNLFVKIHWNIFISCKKMIAFSKFGIFVLLLSSKYLRCFNYLDSHCLPNFTVLQFHNKSFIMYFCYSDLSPKLAINQWKLEFYIWIQLDPIASERIK